MKAFLQIISFASCFVAGYSQDTAITLSPHMVLSVTVPEYRLIELHKLDGWIFKKGSDTTWAQKDIDIAGWEKLKPTELSEKFADKNGKLECWLRLKIKLDTGFTNTNFGLLAQAWAAMDIYINGTLLHSYGNTGTNGKPFREYNPHKKLPIDFTLEKEKEYVIALHFVDFVSPFPRYNLKSSYWFDYFLALELPEMKEDSFDFISTGNVYETIWLSVNMIICLLFWLLVFQNREEKNLRFIAVTSTLVTLLWFFTVFSQGSGISFITYGFSSLTVLFLSPLTIISVILLIARIFNRKRTLLLKVLLSATFVTAFVQLFFEFDQSITAQISLAALTVAYYVITSWQKLRGAQWAVVAGIIVALSFGLIPLIPGLQIPYSISLFLRTGLYLSYPLSLLTYVAIRFREIIKEVQENSKEIVRLSEEKRQQALNQQKLLEEEVAQQTIELRTSLENLKATQAQLIQSEKMASLGELTAGIAHEIQNPLNFVNNFSEVNQEMIDELQTELKAGNAEEAIAISNDIKENSEKINHHGKRADAIVKGMLQHSKTSTSVKEPTDINKLVDEYLRLAYHGMRAKDKEFNVEIKTDFDESIGKINVIPQDIGRVLLNLFNNAFYAVNEKCKVEGECLPADQAGYKAMVSIKTKTITPLQGMGAKVEIIISDNGNGITQNIINKIFQPFFTTKPTGQGTGLGLSLAYDIVKAHGGELKVKTKEKKGSEFTIQLPV